MQQSWVQDLAANYAGSTTVATTASETILVPDVIIPANFLCVGSKIRATIWGIASNTSTPTLTFRARWGGVAGTVLCASAALTTVASAANVSFLLEYMIVCTAIGSLFAMGMFQTGTGLLATPATAMIPATGAAVTSGLTFNASENLSFTVQWGTSSASNTITSELYTCESVSL